MKKWIVILFIISVLAYCLYAQPGPIQPLITNLTQFKNQTAWRVFYSNTDGDVTELALGTDGQYLKSNGASSAPTWTALAGGGDVLADGTVPMTADWDIGGYGLFGLTYLDLTGADASPDATGEIQYDSTVAGMSGGAIRWFDDDSVRLLVDLETDPADDDYVVAYDADADGFYMKVDDDSGGTPTIITVADTTDATSFVALWESATGDLGPKSDLGITYNASTAALSATSFAGDGSALTAIDAATGDSATAFFDAGTIEHEYGGLEADINAYTGLVAITGGATAEVDSKSELEGHIADVANFAEADGDVYTGNADFGGADLELPQAAPGAPDADGEVEIDFTDGSVVIQHGSAHAELGAATDVVVGKLIRSFAATIFAPDGVNDVIPLKMIDDLEFPHGIVIVECLLQVGTDSNYTLTLQNYDDFDTINGANGTIDAVAYTAGNDGEVTDTSITYGTIGAGQIIMMSIPSTDVDWCHIEIFYYEPTA